MTAPHTTDDWSDLDDTTLVPTGKTARELKGDHAKLDTAAGISLGSGKSVEKVVNQVAMFKCEHCHGSGRFVRGFYDPVDYGPCNKCHGTGLLKTDPKVRAARKQSQLKAKAARKAEYLAAHAAEHKWCVERADRFDFAFSMLEAVQRYGSWTDGQLAGIRKCIARDAERAARPSDAQIQGAGFERMLSAFAAAKASGLKYPKFFVGELTFSLAGERSQYAGKALFVKAGAYYLGRIDLGAGAFFKSRDCTPEQVTLIEQVCKDPFAAAVLHGKQTGRCSCCGRELENPESVELGIGPICRRKWGL